jgi:hypothetical protein
MAFSYDDERREQWGNSFDAPAPADATVWIELGLPCGNLGGWRSALARVAVAAALHDRAPRRKWAIPVGVPPSVDTSGLGKVGWHRRGDERVCIPVICMRSRPLPCTRCGEGVSLSVGRHRQLARSI